MGDLTLFLAPILKFLTLIGGLLAAVFLIRRDAKRDARQQTALDAAEQYAKTRSKIDHADIPSDDVGVLREWLRARDPGLK